MKVVILEDEKLTANDLAKTLQSLDGDIEILRILSSLEEARAYFQSNPTLDLIFSDIELGDGLSFELFEQLKLSIPIVFCTAYSKYALDAFNTLGIDYVLKPFSKVSIEKTLSKYQQLQQKLAPATDQYSILLQTLKQQLNPRSPSVIVQQGDRVIPVRGEEIAVFWVEDDYVFAHTFGQKKYLVAQRLDALEKLFAPGFFRANRQFLVNRQAVKDATQHFNRKLQVNLKVPFSQPILIGKLKLSAFLDWLAAP
jgi:DNA-binding LytR/AlgR family response regulator